MKSGDMCRGEASGARSVPGMEQAEGTEDSHSPVRAPAWAPWFPLRPREFTDSDSRLVLPCLHPCTYSGFQHALKEGARERASSHAAKSLLWGPGLHPHSLLEPHEQPDLGPRAKRERKMLAWEVPGHWAGSAVWCSFGDPFPVGLGLLSHSQLSCGGQCLAQGPSQHGWGYGYKCRTVCGREHGWVAGTWTHCRPGPGHCHGYHVGT